MASFLHPRTAEWARTYNSVSLKEQDAASSVSSDGDTDSIEKLDIQLSRQFTDEIRDLAKAKSHRKVAVQLISWEVEHEDCMDTTDELRDLRQVWEERYNFTVYVNKMTTMTEHPARHQLNHCLSEFLLKHDRKDTLLIIYYGGHGIRSLDDGQLRWVAGNPSPTDNGLTEIVWTSTEHLLDRVDADVLAIFDCCHAGVLERDPRGPRTEPIYEFIGSTTFNRTAKGPGQHSFTRALIVSLHKLAERKDGFTTSELLQEIKTFPPFLRTCQQPVSSERSKKVSFKKLQIKPLPTTVDEDTLPPDQDTEEVDPVRYFLTLKYVLSQKPTQNHITSLTRGLHDLVVQESVPIRHVLWDRLHTKLTFKDAAKIAMHRLTQNRRLSAASSAISLELTKSEDDRPRQMSPVMVDESKTAQIAGTEAGPLQVGSVRRINSDRSYTSSDSRCSTQGTASTTSSTFHLILFAFSLGVTIAKGPDFARTWLASGS